MAAKKKARAKKRMGRPPKKPSERKDLKIMVRVTGEQKDLLVERADEAGLDLSNYMLNAALGLLSNP